MADMDTDFRMKPEAGSGYAMSGKIMLSAIVILFAVIIFMVGFHLYARWYLIDLRRRQLQRRRQRRSGGRPQIVPMTDNRYAVSAGDRGLEKAVLDSLPVYLHSSKTGIPSECAVCLSEFEENEVARHLPKCGHSFHTECIDMWFHSHSTCPLCRSPVEQVVNQLNPVLTVNGKSEDVKVPEPGSSSKSKPVPPCQQDEVGGTARRKGLDLMAVRIEVPPRRVQSEDDSAQFPTGFKSPGNGLAYLKRILTISIRSPTSGGIPCESGSSSMATNGDLESCSQESSRVQTPS
ncbi:RING-H2 finger protein ATL64-like [Primulina huaijiensis]|uniref:RING-H2 finger protein ATL64-like n=1 Tax=Primulina huaijiensis TaxID=1492673 RepID=UPI003CC7910D